MDRPHSPRILVTRPLPDSALAPLRERAQLRVLEGDDDRPIPSEDELLASVKDADILFTLPAHPVTRRVLEAAPSLRLVATMGTGYDNVDLAAARARDIRVTNAPGILDETTADLAFALLLATARRIPQAERFMREGHFRGWTPFMFAGGDVHGRTLGIVGLGRIGSAVARRARGFGMKLLYSSPSRKEEVERELGCSHVPLDALLSESDFVSLHCPLDSSTRHLIDGAALERMKRTAVLINTARGPVVDEAALARALREGRIAGAGLDVFEREPTVHPDLLQCENAVLLPHIGSASDDTRLRMAERATANVLAFLDGKPLLDQVA
jgi:glyoxylate reductase